MSNILKSLALVSTIVTLIFIGSCSKTATCTIPSGLSASNVTATSATLNWAAVSGASYTVQFRPVGSSTWSAGVSATNSFLTSALNSSTNYEFEVKSTCGSTETAFSQTGTFTTLGCPTGYEGNNCNTAMNTKFAGTYQVADTGVVSGTSNVFIYSMIITASSSSPTSVSITNLGGFSASSVISATVNGSTLTIPTTTIGNESITNGTGTLNGNILTFSYTATDNTGVSVDHAVGTK